GPVVAKPAPDDPAARRLKYRDFRGGIVEPHLRGPWAGGVRAVGEPPAGVDAVRAGHADTQARLAQDVADHADSGGLPVGPGHGPDRDRSRRARRVKLVDDRARD